MNIIQATQTITTFIKDSFGLAARVISIEKSDDGGWQGEAEVFEESAFIKSLGLNTKVKDRNIYDVHLNATLEVVGYTRRTEATR
jgi:hypothetical protein